MRPERNSGRALFVFAGNVFVPTRLSRAKGKRRNFGSQQTHISNPQTQKRRKERSDWYLCPPSTSNHFLVLSVQYVTSEGNNAWPSPSQHHRGRLRKTESFSSS